MSDYTFKTAGVTKLDPTKTFVGKVRSQKTPLVGTILTMPSITVAQLVGQSDSDVVMIDMEHAPQSMEVVTQMVHAYAAASRGRGFPLIRIPSHGVEWIKWALDSGSAGIVVPMVNDVGEMKAIIDRALYPPHGRRSFGPIAAPYAHPDGPKAEGGQAGYFERARNGSIALLPMIESKEGLQNVEAIVSLEGVSGVLVGPADLRLSLGLPVGIDGPEPEFADALKTIVGAATKHGKVVGIVALGEDAIRKRAAEGFEYILSAFDAGSLMSGLASELAMAKRGVEAGTAKL